MRWMVVTTVARWALWMALAALLGACELDADEVGPRCGDDPTALVEGRWRIEATGDRSGCGQGPVPDAEGVAISSLALPISQQGESLWLTEALEEAPSFSLDGDVLGRCVRFWTSESTPYGGVRYSFSGNAAGAHVSGRFTATGPGTCRTEGTFTIRVR